MSRMPRSYRQVEKFFCLQLAFQPDRIQPHVLHIAQLVTHALLVLAQHHVGGPATAADQNVFAVDGKQPPVGRQHLRLDFANSKSRFSLIGNLAVHVELRLRLYSSGLPIWAGHHKRG